jgi:hypothetical protein
MIYWMNKPIIELISRFNDPLFNDFMPKWGARTRLLPAHSSSYLRIDLIHVRHDYRCMNDGLNLHLHLKCLEISPITSTELKILIYWALEAKNEFRDADERMFGYCYPMMSVTEWKTYSSGAILNFLKNSDMLPRVLRLFLRQKRQLLRQ